MRRLAVIVTVSLLPMPALAASPDPAPAGSVRSQFYIFEGSSFEAGANGPSLDLVNPRQAARFGRLASLKKDLLGGLGKTLKERALR